eukprot:666757_1
MINLYQLQIKQNAYNELKKKYESALKQCKAFEKYSDELTQTIRNYRTVIPNQISTDEHRTSPSEHHYKQASKCIKSILFDHSDYVFDRSTLCVLFDALFQ